MIIQSNGVKIFNPIHDAFVLALPANSETELSFETDDFVKIKAEAERTADELQQAKTEVLTAIDKLREGWKTPAGNYFFEKIDSDWVTSMDKYISALNLFRDVMENLNDDLSEVIERAETIEL